MTKGDDELAAIQRRVDQLLDFEFESIANWAATQLRHGGSCYVELCPGDSTRYAIAIVQWHNYHRNRGLMPGWQDRWFLAHSLGPLYEWGAGAPVHWSYVRDKWVHGNTPTADYTAMVLARFMNVLSPLLTRNPADPPTPSS